MTLPHERTRAVVQTYDFLVELSLDASLPHSIRHDALFLLRHYPSQADVLQAGENEEKLAKMPLMHIDPIFSSSTKWK
ncbi:BPSL0761 family protein [Serpens gallinarum]|uniref:Uncharacterized protein n=1 Tax=Serpens gallinarum TaxID=2763075 RepID=A0ABR8TMV6_9PSED|nr:BPSL0761 family protein [Serpens gallinarum]MBD7976813.1 hypothetical protein [Serpens gallinarum]